MVVQNEPQDLRGGIGGIKLSTPVQKFANTTVLQMKQNDVELFCG